MTVCLSPSLSSHQHTARGCRVHSSQPTSCAGYKAVLLCARSGLEKNKGATEKEKKRWEMNEMHPNEALSLRSCEWAILKHDKIMRDYPPRFGGQPCIIGFQRGCLVVWAMMEEVSPVLLLPPPTHAQSSVIDPNLLARQTDRNHSR